MFSSVFLFNGLMLDFFFNKKNLFIFGCAGSSLLLRLFSSCGEQGLLSGCSAQASLVAEHRLYVLQASVVAARGLGGCGSWALEHRLSHCGTWA